MTTAFTAIPGAAAVTAAAAIPGLGCIGVNAFVPHGSEPVLVDTDAVAGNAEFTDPLATAIDPTDLRNHALSTSARRAAKLSHSVERLLESPGREVHVRRGTPDRLGP